MLNKDLSLWSVWLDIFPVLYSLVFELRVESQRSQEGALKRERKR